MKPNRVMPLLLAAFVLTVCCLVSCEEECDPCSLVCPDAADRLIGSWIIFEAFMDGNPDTGPVGYGLDFRVNDTLIVTPFADTLKWDATDDRIIIIDDAGPITAFVFDYFFQADTLDMSGDQSGIITRWRLLREEDMPTP